MSWQDTPCKIWEGAVAGGGYGYVRDGDRTRRVHIVEWEKEHGPVPDGKVLDHLCRVRLCYETKHLEPVTQAENLLRGEHPAVVLHRTGICGRGHDTRVLGLYGRRCAECCRINQRVRRARQKEIRL